MNRPILTATATFFALFFATSAFSQTSNNCTSAQPHSADTCTNNGFASFQTQKWFSFLADSSGEYHISVRPPSDTTHTATHPHKITLYTGSCTMLTPVDSISNIDSSLTLAFVVDSLVKGNQYYIKIERDLAINCSAGTCTDEETFFQICIAFLPNEPHANLLVICQDKTVFSAGSPNNGMLGRTPPTTGFGPVECLGVIPGLKNIVATATGFDHSLALDADGFVWAWGDNKYGQLGLGSNVNSTLTPKRVEGLCNVKAIEQGKDFLLPYYKTAQL